MHQQEGYLHLAIVYSLYFLIFVVINVRGFVTVTFQEVAVKDRNFRIVRIPDFTDIFKHQVLLC